MENPYRQGGRKDKVRQNSLNNLIPKASHFLKNVLRKTGSYLIGGLFIIIPGAVTLWLLIWLFNQIDGLLAPILEWVMGRHVPGLGFAVIIILLILIGFFGMIIGNRRFFSTVEIRIMKLPIIGAVYSSVREILTSFHTANNDKFLETVLIEFPRKGIYSIGFVTRETINKNGEKFLNVFMPTSPTPFGGYLQIVPESEVVHTSMSINEAMKLLISIGRVSREDIADILNRAPDNNHYV
jgi:uncharacterized membrane protein